MQKVVLLIGIFLSLTLGNITHSQQNKPAEPQQQTTKQQDALAELKQQVMDTERAFAQTMAKRDYKAFTSFLSTETVFVGSEKVLRGKQQVMEVWKQYYEKPDAPFSWKPEYVEVFDSGTLALSSGPVYGANGTLVSTFTSIWRLEAPGTWRIIYDKGNKLCYTEK